MNWLHILLCFTTSAFVALEASAWDCSSAHRNRIDVAAGASGHSEEIRIDLSSADFPASYEFTPDGADVRVFASDNTTPVNHVVTGWDGVARTGTIYIRPAAVPANTSTSFFVYYGDADAGDIGNPTAVFPTSGIRLHSRSTTADPGTAAEARADFAAATGIADSVFTSVSGLNNQNPAIGGAATDFAWCVSAMLQVTPATAGVWGFRYGADFGLGGHLYVREQEVEAQWADNLWWNNSFNNTAETLEGTIFLNAGWHRYEALGFEDCCDGAVGFQARAPGGAWQDMSSTNFNLRATRCIVTNVTITPQAAQSCSTTPNAIKTAMLVSDPVGDGEIYALPGAIVEYAITVSNPGTPPDGGSLVLTDALPPDVKLIVAGGAAFSLVEGGDPSGLSLSWIDAASTVDNVAFSTDGSTFDYIPTSDADGADAAITHVRFTPTGEMNPSINGSSPSFSIRFRTIVR